MKKLIIILIIAVSFIACNETVGPEYTPILYQIAGPLAPYIQPDEKTFSIPCDWLNDSLPVKCTVSKNSWGSVSSIHDIDITTNYTYNDSSIIIINDSITVFPYKYFMIIGVLKTN